MGIIQNAINQTIGTVGIAAMLDPRTEDKKVGRKLELQEQQLDEAYENLVNAPVPKWQTPIENSEYTTETALDIISQLEDVRLKRAIRQEGSGFTGFLEARQLRSYWTEEETIMKRANERAAQINQAQNAQRNNFNNFVNTVRSEAEIAASNRQNAFMPGAAATPWQRGGNK